MERRRSLGLGHRGGQLRHLQEPHHGPVHRVPGQPGKRENRGLEHINDSISSTIYIKGNTGMFSLCSVFFFQQDVI